MGMQWVARFLVLAFAGCVSAEIGHSPGQENRSHSIVEDNGINLNGLMANGLMQNGLTLNGAQLNGAQLNGAQLNGFSINGLSLDESLNVMKYLVKCALADYQTMTINVDGTDYDWPGTLGLAPEWAAGPLTDEGSQQWVSACLLALANADGNSVPISVRGDSSLQPALSWDDQEASDYPLLEAAFAGNLFSAPGSVRACSWEWKNVDRTYLSDLGRRCAFTPRSCAGVGWCESECHFLVAPLPCGSFPFDPDAAGFYRYAYSNTITVYDRRR